MDYAAEAVSKYSSDKEKKWCICLPKVISKMLFV
jgi:hypothetical protein